MKNILLNLFFKKEGTEMAKKDIPPLNVETEVDNEKSVYYGTNINTNSPIYYDKTKQNNGHEIIIGVAGSGKTYLCKSELKDIYKNTNDAIIVIQDRSEVVTNSSSENNKDCSYSSLAELYNEKHIKVSNYCVNPFQLYSVDTEVMEEDKFCRKEEFIMVFIKSIIEEDLTPIQKSIIYKIVKEMYSDYNHASSPTMSVLLNALKNRNSKELENIIKKLEGKLDKGLNHFDCRNKIELNNKFVVYSMYSVKREVYYDITLILLESIWNNVVINGEKGIRTHIVIDCIELLSDNEIISEFIVQLIRRLRVHGGMITLICSNVEYILNNEHNRMMLENMSTIRLLSQNKNDIELISKYFSLPNELIDFIDNTERGTGLLCSQRAIIPFRYEEIL